MIAHLHELLEVCMSRKKQAPKTSYDARNRRWILQGKKNGKRKNFYSKESSKTKAKIECESKYWEWYELVESPGTTPFVNAWEEYAKDYSARYKASSTDTLKSRGKAYLTKRFGKRPVQSIKRMEWQEVINDAHERGLSKYTLVGIGSLITNFCVFCASQGYIHDSAVPRNLFIPATAPTGTKRALYPSELQMLLSPDSSAFSWYMPHFRFLVLTGIRRGELCALQEERDYQSPYITIRETISHELVLGTPKSGKTRTEILTTQALEALEDHRRRRIQLGINSEYLFCSTTGGRINPKVLSEEWRKYRKAHSIDDITLHELRHTFATYSHKSLTVDDLKSMLGHGRKMDTLGTYVHEVPLTPAEIEKKRLEDKERASKIDAIFQMISEL